MTNLYKLLFLITFVVAGTYEAFAYSFEVNGIYYNVSFGDSTVYVTCGHYSSNSYSGMVTIPQKVTYNNKTYSVTSIGSGAFLLCTGLTSVAIPNSVTSIGSAAFDGCTGLTSVTIPNSVTSIGSSAFEGCTGLTSVAIPNSVTYIGDNAFYGCSNLLNVIIEGPISIVMSDTFKDCRKLKSVSLPYTVTAIKSKAFYFCEELTDFTCLAKTPPVINEFNSIYPGYYMATLHVPEHSVEAYRATDWWSHFINIVGDASEDDTIPNTPATDKCDTNDDGEVNIADVNRVIDAILSH